MAGSSSGEFWDRSGFGASESWDGTNGDDTIKGGPGNDTVSGGPGNDIFIFNTGDGKDTIKADDANGTDTLQLGKGIKKSDLYTQRSGDDLVLRIGKANESVTLKDWYKAGAPKAIDEIKFDDGSTLKGKDLEKPNGEAPATDIKKTIRKKQKTLVGKGGNDRLTGRNNKKDVLKGYKGDDTLLGKGGNDKLYGGWGNDVLKGGKGNDRLYGDNGDDRLYGESGNDKLFGGNGNDRLSGGAGKDTLIGGNGRDTLTGGKGKDVFLFNAKLSKDGTNVDVIKDFKHGVDKIQLTKSFVSKLKTGTLKKKNFRANATGTAMDRNDYIVYNTKTGALLYDADGSGKGAAVEIATLTNKAKLTAADIVIKKK